MLRLRNRPMLQVFRTLPTLRDMLATSDQGFVRLQMAFRGTLSVFLSTMLAVVVANHLGFSPVECAGGITFSMMAPFLMREPTRPQRQRTLVLLLLPAMAASVLTTLLHEHPVAGDSTFLALVFICFLLAPRSASGLGLGLIAVITTYVGLYLKLPPATLPIQLGAQVVAVPLTALACFVLVPMDAAATLRRSVAAVQARAAQVIRAARSLDVTAGAAVPPGAAAGLRRALMRLNQAALMADDQLALFTPAVASAVRARLVDVEFWTARVIDALEQERPARRLATRLALHARRLERGGRYALRPERLQPGTMLGALVGLGHAVHALGQVMRAQPAVLQAPPPGPQAMGKLAWRMATRVTLAAGLAMAGGMALSPQRWFWAVITVYVVFLNVRSRGDTIYKGLQRLGGTLLGMVSGLLIATLFSGHGALESIALLLSIFGMYYFFMVSYTVGIFFVTVMLGLLYGVLGAPLESVLVLRLEETMVGAAAAIFVATFVLPTPTRQQVLKSGRAVLAQLAAVVQDSALAIAGQPTPPLAASMRQVDRLVADLKLALAPLVAGRAMLRRSTVERPISALLDCVHWTRILVAEVSAAPTQPANARQIAPLHDAAMRLEALAKGETPEPAFVHETPAMDPVGRAAGNLDQAINTLAERVALGIYETYAIDP